MKRRDFVLGGLKFGSLSLLPLQSFLACAGTNPESIWPPPRNSHASAFNSHDNELLVFGGSLKDGDDNELWLFKNNEWRRISSSSGPGKREDALFLYHNENQKAYLIGGRSFSSNTSYKDFWEWSGSDWYQLSNETPFGNLTHAAATYDTKNNRILVFGGVSGSTLTNDLWIWNGTTWAKSLATGPSARLAASILYSPVHEKVYLFGGALSNGTVIPEVWELDDETWVKLNDDHPALLTNAYGVAPHGSNFILFGGFKENREQGAETWIYNVNENAWTSVLLSPPSPRALHSMVYDPTNQRVLMFGGSSSGGVLLDELWSFEGTEWSRIVK